MSITESDVRHVAALARIGLDDARIPALVDEINGILVHMEALQQAAVPDDVAGELTAAPMPLRDDAAPADPLQYPRESFAPSMRDGFFLVPRLATHGEVPS